MIDNAREVSVLAAGLLDAAAADGKVYAALAILTASASGLRHPSVRPDLIEAMRATIQELAINSRKQPAADPNIIKQPATSKLTDELTNLVAAPEIAKAVSLLVQMNAESAAVAKTLTKQVYAVVQPLAEQVQTLREEVEMLWWHIGGWSRLLDKPFADLELGLAAVLAGIDMADMSRSVMGPAAAPAILQRTLAGHKPTTTMIPVKDAVAALSTNEFDRLILGDKLNAVPDICPVLTAFAKAAEIGPAPAWHATYSKAIALNKEPAFKPLDLAMQSYRERLLLRAMN